VPNGKASKDGMRHRRLRRAFAAAAVAGFLVLPVAPSRADTAPVDAIAVVAPEEAQNPAAAVIPEQYQAVESVAGGVGAGAGAPV
jgi:hypothetical protein